MASLLDIGPLTEEVEIRGVTLTVRGLSARNIFQLFSEFPSIRKTLEESDGNPQVAMMTMAPTLIGKIVAMATGLTPSKEVEDKALEMSPDDLLNILEAVQRLSLPNEIGPFVERVTALMDYKTIQSPASMRSVESKTESPARFSASLQTDTQAGFHGHTRRVN